MLSALVEGRSRSVADGVQRVNDRVVRVIRKKEGGVKTVIGCRRAAGISF